jgi:glycosyltransferase involved in cell wall biosynthesis
MRGPFFSIIVPTYNSSNTISKCLDSLTGQSYEDFEIIIIDACSSDNTLYLVKNYKEKYANIRFISEKDDGIYDAMNKGAQLSTGEWLYFLGSNDYLINNKVLEELTKRVNMDEYEFVYGNVSSPEYGDKYDGAFDREKIMNHNICHQALFVRRSLFNRFGGLNARYKLLADYDFNLHCMFDNSVRKKYVDLTIAYYSPGGVSSRSTDELFIQNKNWLVLKYGFSSFSWGQRINLLRQHFKQVFFSGKN